MAPYLQYLKLCPMTRYYQIFTQRIRPAIVVMLYLLLLLLIFIWFCFMTNAAAGGASNAGQLIKRLTSYQISYATHTRTRIHTHIHYDLLFIQCSARSFDLCQLLCWSIDRRTWRMRNVRSHLLLIMTSSSSSLTYEYASASWSTVDCRLNTCQCNPRRVSVCLYFN